MKYIASLLLSSLLCLPCMAQSKGSLVKKGKSILKTTVQQLQTKKTQQTTKQNQATTASTAQTQNKEVKKVKSVSVAAANGNTITVKGVSFEMVKVEAGTFTMGGTPEMQNDYAEEKPVHKVTITKDFYIGKTEVTQALWTAVMGSNPSWYEGNANRPVESVTWNDCQTFIEKLNAATGKKFRLPTEAEWEFAARGGNKSKHYHFSGSNNLADVAWCEANSDYKTHDVATKQPNELGLYDMSGNVCEWCSDWFGEYSASAQTNPTGSKSGKFRVNRGGERGSEDYGCTPSYRFRSEPDVNGKSLGFRLAFTE